ncbi:radical SAM protein [Candidatus Bathyarchaeota archaeon]|nr:radical SAM protein [Candidatus Bathyarchaeota archaeon]
MEILLVNPPTYNGMGYLKAFRIQEMPMSLAYLAAIAEEEGHTVRIMDMNVIKTKKEFFKQAMEFNFQLIGFTSTTSTLNNCLKSIKIFHTLHPGARIILGGWHASALPEETLDACELIDIIVRGEGEITFKELVAALEDGRDLSTVKGLAFRDKLGNPVSTPERELLRDMDSLPFPARHLLPLHEYSKMGVSYIVYDVAKLRKYMKDGYPVDTHILTSRGCYNRCSFCADHLIYKQKCRFHSAEYVVDEIKDAVERFNARIFNVMDPVFLLNQGRVRRICELLLEREIDIQWCCQGRVSNQLTVKLLELMKRAGCQKVYYGIESGSPRILKMMNKNIKIAQIKDTIRKTRDAGMPFHVFFLYGFPGETMMDYAMTWQLIKDTKPDNIEIHKVIPLPGTDLYERSTKQKILKNKEWSRFHYYAKNEDYLEANQEQQKAMVEKYFFRLSKRFNISFRYIKNFLKRIKTLDHAWSIVRGFKTFIEYHLFISRHVS